jgi:hypothetical protein
VINHRCAGARPWYSLPNAPNRLSSSISAVKVVGAVDLEANTVVIGHDRPVTHAAARFEPSLEVRLSRVECQSRSRLMVTDRQQLALFGSEVGGCPPARIGERWLANRSLSPSARPVGLPTRARKTPHESET